MNSGRARRRLKSKTIKLSLAIPYTYTVEETVDLAGRHVVTLREGECTELHMHPHEADRLADALMEFAERVRVRRHQDKRRRRVKYAATIRPEEKP